MLRRMARRDRMFGLFVAGLVLLNPPILDLVGGTLFGWPALYLYFFIIWALLIAGVALISDHKSARHDVGTLLSKTSAMLAQKTRRRVPLACARSFPRSGPRQ